MIPARNEIRAVGLVVREACIVARRVIVVDDGSTDSTADAARHAGALVVRREQSLGQGASILAGMEHARSLGITHVVTLDADGAHAPQDALGLWRVHRASEADLTLGSRFLKSSEVPTSKIAANTFGTIIFNHLRGSSFSDVASGMRLMGPSALALPLSGGGFSFTFDLLDRALSAHLKIAESSISARYDAAKPYITLSGEILEFLAVCTRIAKKPEDSALLANCQQLVASMATFRVSLFDQEFFFHAIQDRGGYLVQRQHEWFERNREEDARTAIEMFAE